MTKTNHIASVLFGLIVLICSSIGVMRLTQIEEKIGTADFVTEYYISYGVLLLIGAGFLMSGLMGIVEEDKTKFPPLNPN